MCSECETLVSDGRSVTTSDNFSQDWMGRALSRHTLGIIKLKIMGALRIGVQYSGVPCLASYTDKLSKKICFNVCCVVLCCTVCCD